MDVWGGVTVLTWRSIWFTNGVSESGELLPVSKEDFGLTLIIIHGVTEFGKKSNTTLFLLLQTEGIFLF